MTRSLLLKGLAGVAAIGGAVGGGLVAVNSGLLGGGKVKEQESKDLSNFNHKELIDKVGLSCGIEGDEVTDSPKDCTVKEKGSINVRLGDQTEEEGVRFTANGSKLKVSKSEGYSRELKFVVDSGDLTLNKKEGGGAATNIPKLEQFETYEVFLKEDGKFFLSRKTDAKEEKMKALGLSKCTLPDTGTSECSLTTEGDIKAVKFEGQNGEEITLSSGEVTLKISKVEDKTSFPDGYRFTFTFPSEVTINNKKVKANTPYDFKIKKGESGNTLTLERVWSEDKEFAKKAGLTCNGDQNECTVSSSNLNIKVGEQKKEGITTTSGSGKIKMEAEQEGYNQGLKFSITKGDVSWTTADGDAITKLEELETYEITEEGGKYYLTRKTNKDDGIKSSLVLPKGCDLPTTDSVECDISTEDFKKINFKDKSSPSASEKVKLKISKATNTTDFPLGYRFTFNTTAEATIANENKIKANIPTDFKIKKSESTPTTLSLEKAWENTNFAAKVGLTCSSASGGEECCTKTGSEKLNVKKGNDVKTDIESVTLGTGKIKVEKDQAGYNQGLKFTITGGSVSLTSGTSAGGSDFNTLDEYETYEIKEEGGKYYLTRKDEASKTIGDLLGLPDKCKLSSSTTTCSGLSSQDLQKISFKDKEAGKPTISSGTASLTISKADATDFPLGYKFSLQSTNSDITIKKDQSNNNIVKQNTSYDFKIKKETNNPTSLTLEKAWTADSLGKKVGFKCCDDKTKECTIENNNKLNIKQDDKKDTNLTKNGSSSSGKIKFEKDQEGYNQGLKFKIEDASISLSGGSQTTDDKKIKSLDEYETYEIKEESGQWFFVRKIKADDFILKELGLTGISGCSSLKLPKNGSLETCSIPDVNVLKNINFENKSGHNWPSSVSGVQLEINSDTTLTGGFKFIFNGCSSSCSLPGSSSASKDNSGGLIYQIKKDSKSGKLSLEPKNSKR